MYEDFPISLPITRILKTRVNDSIWFTIETNLNILGAFSLILFWFCLRLFLGTLILVKRTIYLSIQAHAFFLSWWPLFSLTWKTYLDFNHLIWTNFKMGQCEYSLVYTKDYFYWFGQVYITYHINKKVTDCLNNLAKKCNVLITSSEGNSYASFDLKKNPSWVRLKKCSL